MSCRLPPLRGYCWGFGRLFLGLTRPGFMLSPFQGCRASKTLRPAILPASQVEILAALCRQLSRWKPPTSAVFSEGGTMKRRVIRALLAVLVVGLSMAVPVAQAD